MLQHFSTTTLSKLAVKKTIDDYEKNQKENVGTLQPPKFVLIVGIGSMIIWGVLMLLVVFLTRDLTTWILCGVVFGSLFALGLFLVLYERNYKVIYKEGVIIYRGLLRITREYECQNIEHAYYKDSGGIQFVFKDGKKLSFSREEYYFYNQVLRKEKIKAKYKGEENPVIKVGFHPFFMYPCWFVCAISTLGILWAPELIVFIFFLFLFCLGCQLSYTTYDKESKILIRRRCGFTKKYDMRQHTTKPVYENGFLMTIEIYKNKKKVGSIPVSVEYKNRARMIHTLCRIEV